MFVRLVSAFVSNGRNPSPQSGRDVARFSLVNHRARRLCADEDLWKELCVRNFSIHPCSTLPPRVRVQNEEQEEEGEEGEQEWHTWKSLYEMHHEVLYALFRTAGRKTAMGGSTGVIRDTLGAGLGAISRGQVGGVSISIGA